MQLLAGLHEIFLSIITSQVTSDSIMVFFDVDQQTKTSLDDVLAGLQVRILLLIVELR